LPQKVTARRGPQRSSGQKRWGCLLPQSRARSTSTNRRPEGFGGATPGTTREPADLRPQAVRSRIPLEATPDGEPLSKFDRKQDGDGSAHLRRGCGPAVTERGRPASRTLERNWVDGSLSRSRRSPRFCGQDVSTRPTNKGGLRAPRVLKGVQTNWMVGGSGAARSNGMNIPPLHHAVVGHRPPSAARESSATADFAVVRGVLFSVRLPHHLKLPTIPQRATGNPVFPGCATTRVVDVVHAHRPRPRRTPGPRHPTLPRRPRRRQRSRFQQLDGLSLAGLVVLRQAHRVPEAEARPVLGGFQIGWIPLRGSSGPTNGCGSRHDSWHALERKHIPRGPPSTYYYGRHLSGASPPDYHGLHSLAEVRANGTNICLRDRLPAHRHDVADPRRSTRRKMLRRLTFDEKVAYQGAARGQRDQDAGSRPHVVRTGRRGEVRRSSARAARHPGQRFGSRPAPSDSTRPVQEADPKNSSVRAAGCKLPVLCIRGKHFGILCIPRIWAARKIGQPREKR